MDMKKILLAMCVALFSMGAQAQVMKAADLEKYAKQRYGDKWLDAAKNLARTQIGRASCRERV